MKRIKHFKVLSIAVAFILVFSVVFPLSTRAENASTDKFTAEQSINGTKVTVSADPEVFPEGTTMEVKEVNLTSTEDSLVASQQQADQKSIKKVALDITMKNKEGQEIEPDTSKGKVHVSFTNDDIKDHTTNVYHIDDNLKVESLKLTKSDDTVTGETTGFSVYVMNFIVGNTTIHYGAQLREEFNLSKVLSKLLNVDASNIKNVTSNNETDFKNYGSLTNKDDGFYLKIKKQFPAGGNGLYFNVSYTNADKEVATATLNITGYSQPPFSGDASWLNNYTLSKEDENHTITLYQYNGTDKDLNIPATVKIGDENYQITLSGGVYKSTAITSISFMKDDTSGVSVKAADSLKELFQYCSSLNKVDLTGLNTENVTDMSYMFAGDYLLKYVGTSDNTNQVIFSGDGSKFTTKNVVTMEAMFMNMAGPPDNKDGLRKLDVSSFDTTNLKETNLFAAWNTYLEEVNLGSFRGAISNDAANDDSTPLRGTDALTKLTLGENWHARDYKTYSSLGIDGNWKYTEPNSNFKNIIFSNEEINTNFYKDMAGTYEKTDEAPSSASRPLYVADGYKKEGNMWEVHTPQNTFHGYCLDHNRLQPSGYYDKVVVDKDATSNTSTTGVSNYIMDYLDKGNTGYRELGSNMTEALIALIYWSEYGGHKGPYDQNDVWHFTNDYSSGIAKDSQLYAKIHGLRYTGLDERGVKVDIDYQVPHTYNDIPNKEKYKLYIYMPSELNLSPEKDQMQNLLSIEGANDQTYAGVQVKKVDNTPSKAPVSGAKFAVYHATAEGKIDSSKTFGTGEDHLEFTTNSAGVGGIYRMDKTLGLTVGKYILQEISAPSGYKLNSKPFQFEVTDNDDQKILSVGDNGVIVDDVDETYVGGGITLTKVDSTTGKALSNAEFTLYETDVAGNILKDTNNKPIYSKTYTTDENGVLKTGLKDLEINKDNPKYYIVVETKAPEGYDKLQQDTGKEYQSDVINLVKTVFNDESNKYKDIGVVKNVPQTVEVQIEATKQFLGGSLVGNEFTFNLKDAQGNLIDTAKNDANGKIKFNKLTLSAADMPGKDYYIEEVPNTSTISGQTITYDTHKEPVKVLLETVATTGTDATTSQLKATVKYSDDTNGAVFVNQLNVNYDGKLNVHKTVTNSLTSSDEFNFYVEIQSPAADLASKEFSYTLDGKTGKFKFNRLSTKTDTGLYRYKTAEGTFKLKDQSNLKFTDLPRGAQYIVTEDEENGYKLVKSENTTGTLTETEVTAKFTNEANSIIPTSADSMTRMSFWILGSAGALVFVLILKRRLKASKK